MSVSYTVIFKDRTRASCIGACFRKMARSEWDFDNDRPASAQSVIQLETIHDISSIWRKSDYKARGLGWPRRDSNGTIHKTANKAFLAEMEILFADLPWLNDVITIHPVVGVVRAHIKKHPADKIITSLMLVRNLCNMTDIAATYRHYRAEGYRPRLCAILAHLVTKCFGVMGHFEFFQQSLGEYNWINPGNFGKNAFIQMMKADKDTKFDFIQRSWSEQKGYRRDAFYRQNPLFKQGIDLTISHFDPIEGGWLPFDTRYEPMVRWDWKTNKPSHVLSMDKEFLPFLFTRNVVDCYSISEDEPIPDSPQIWNSGEGMTILRRDAEYHSFKTPSSKETMDQLLKAMEKLCTEEGVSVYL